MSDLLTNEILTIDHKCLNIRRDRQTRARLDLLEKIIYAVKSRQVAIVPIALSPAMFEVLDTMLTNCHTIEESYADLLRAASQGQEGGHG
jgi:hypothetical protein